MTWKQFFGSVPHVLGAIVVILLIFSPGTLIGIVQRIILQFKGPVISFVTVFMMSYIVWYGIRIMLKGLLGGGSKK